MKLLPISLVLVIVFASSAVSTMPACSQQTNGPRPNPQLSECSTVASNLQLYIKVWGFLKYHHPAATTGRIPWDEEFFRVLPAVIDAEFELGAQSTIMNWIDGLGEVPNCTKCSDSPDDAVLPARTDWIDGGFLEPGLKQRLSRIHKMREVESGSHFVASDVGVYAATFVNELPYEAGASHRLEYRLLAIARFWNMVEYWYPYRDLIPSNWDGVLREYLEKAARVRTTAEYNRMLTALATQLGDSHAKWRVTEGIPFTGQCIAPWPLRFIENSLVVWEHAATSTPVNQVLQIADIIVGIDGAPVDDILQESSEFLPASNRGSRLRDLARSVTRGECSTIALDILRNGEQRSVEVSRIRLQDVDVKRFRHDRYGDAFQQLLPSVSYLKISEALVDDIPSYLEAIGESAFVIDLRGYPKESLARSLGQHLVQKASVFAKFSVPDFGTPCAFVWGPDQAIHPKEPFLSTNVYLLVDETTQSAAGFIGMAFQAQDAVVTIGSSTAGADGDFVGILLPGGVHGGFSGVGIYYPDRQQTQQVGLKVDLQVTPTIEGIRAKRDELLEAALREIVAGRLSEDEIQGVARRQ